MSTENEHCHIIKLRGLPWNVSAHDILEFLKEIEVSRGENGIHLITSPRDGRPNGEAFVECSSENDYNRAFDFHKKVMGHRYIEIFGAKQDEFEYIMRKQNIVQQDTFVKLRGLPYSVNTDDIEKFFEGLELRKDKDSIQIMMDNRSRATGEAFVQFVSPADTEKALKKNREKIGHRYIEIFRSTSAEVRRNTYYSRPGPYNRNDRGGSAGAVRRNSNFIRNGRNLKDGVCGLPNPWSVDDVPWKNREMGDNFNNFGGNNFSNGGGGGGGNTRNINENHYGNNNFGNGNFGMNDNFNSGNNGGNFGRFSGNFSNNNIGGFDDNFNSDNYNNSGNNFGQNNAGNFNRDDVNSNNYGGNNFGGNNFGANCMGRGNFDRFGGDNNGGNNGGWNNMHQPNCVHLRGLPYDSDEKDILKFFLPLKVTNCNVIYNNRGRHSGEADAYFSSEADAIQAMSRHKEKMGNRYIELFFNSKENRRNNGN